MNLVSFARKRPISLLTIVLAAALAGFLALDRMSRGTSTRSKISSH